MWPRLLTVLKRPVELQGLHTLRHEGATLLRAGASSAVATAVDGAAYQLLLYLGDSHYGTAAITGAALGAVTNFSLNRAWAFQPTGRALVRQAIEYAAVSLITYSVLRWSLYMLVEVHGLHEGAAWVPAKAVAWLFASYPMQRFVVFAGPVHARARS